MPNKIILGSSSKWRQRILRNAGLEFTVMTPNVNEKHIRDSDPSKMALAIANAKADILLPEIHEPALLITADQVVVCGNEIYEKPSSPAEARKFLRSYATNPASTVTAVVVVNTATMKRASGVDIVTLHFKPLADELIEQLIAEGEIFHCAGAFQAEDDSGHFNSHILSVDGNIDSVQGLPLKLTMLLLENIN